MDSHGTYSEEYAWARKNTGRPEADRFLDLARMYAACPDPACLGLIESAAERIRTERQDKKKGGRP